MRSFLAPALLALATTPALAADPTCPVAETCKHSNDNCQPAEGMLLLRLLPSGKVEVRLNDNAPQEATVLQMTGQTIMLFGSDGEEHQLRLAPDGKFNYLISIPDPSAPEGKDQTLYRGQCVEG
jgi:hypothetical protein